MIAPLLADLCKLLWSLRSLAHRGTGRLALRLGAVALVVGIGLATGGGDLAAIDWSLLSAWAAHSER